MNETRKYRKEENRFFIYIFGFSGESEAGLDEGVEEGCSSLEPLSQEDCASKYSASSSRRVRNQPESLSLTVGDPFTEAQPPENSRKKRKLFPRNGYPFILSESFEVERCYSFVLDDSSEKSTQPFSNFKVIPNNLWINEK